MYFGAFTRQTETFKQSVLVLFVNYERTGGAQLTSSQSSSTYVVPVLLEVARVPPEDLVADAGTIVVPLVERLPRDRQLSHLT